MFYFVQETCTRKVLLQVAASRYDRHARFLYKFLARLSLALVAYELRVQRCSMARGFLLLLGVRCMSVPAACFSFYLCCCFCIIIIIVIFMPISTKP